MEQLDLPLGNLKSSSCFLLLLAPYGKGERALPCSNPYLLWTMASRWSQRPSPLASKLQSLLLSPPFLLFLAWVWERVERWTRERVGVWEWVSELVDSLSWCFHEMDSCGDVWDQVIHKATSYFCMGLSYRTVRHGGGLSGGVRLLTDSVLSS